MYFVEGKGKFSFHPENIVFIYLSTLVVEQALVHIDISVWLNDFIPKHFTMMKCWPPPTVSQHSQLIKPKWYGSHSVPPPRRHRTSWNMRQERAPYITAASIGEQKRHSSRGLHSFIQYVECCNGVVKPWWRHVIAGSLRRSRPFKSKRQIYNKGAL